MPTRRRVSSCVESAATASMPASMARSTRSGSISTTTKGTPAWLQFAGGAAADAAEAANDVVILQIVDHAFFPPLADGVAELEFDDGLGHGADGDEDGGDAEDDEEGIEDASGARERMDLAVAHRGHGGQRHVEGIERRVVVDDGEADGSDGERGGEGHADEDKAPCEPVHGDVWIKYSGNARHAAQVC